MHLNNITQWVNQQSNKKHDSPDSSHLYRVNRFSSLHISVHAAAVSDSMNNMHITWHGLSNMDQLKCRSEAYLPATAPSRSIEHSPSDSTDVRFRIRTLILMIVLVLLDGFSSKKKKKKVPVDFLFFPPSSLSNEVQAHVLGGNSPKWDVQI